MTKRAQLPNFPNIPKRVSHIKQAILSNPFISDITPKEGEPSFQEWFHARYPKVAEDYEFQYKAYLDALRRLNRGKSDTQQDR